MITKKEILQKIATKEIKSLDQIEKKYLQDEDILKLYLMTAHQDLLLGSNNIKKKLDELIKELKKIGPEIWFKKQKNKKLELDNSKEQTSLKSDLKFFPDHRTITKKEIFELKQRLEQKKEEEAIITKRNNQKINAIEKIDKDLLSKEGFMDQDFVILYLKDKLFSNFLENYDPIFLQSLHPNLLKNDEILDEYLKYPFINEDILNSFDKSLINKFHKKKFNMQFTLQFYKRYPFEPYVFFDTDKFSPEEDGSYFSNAPMAATKAYSIDDKAKRNKIINKVFSRIEFPDAVQNKYFNNLNKIPKDGFPCEINPYESDMTNTIDEAFDKNKPYFHIWDTDLIYESEPNEHGEYFHTNDYLSLQMFYGFIWFLDQYIMNWYFELEDKFLITDKEDKEIEEFLFIYSQMNLNVKKTQDRDKFKKLFIKKFNHTYGNSKIKINDIFFKDITHDEPPDLRIENDRPTGRELIQFDIEFVGIKKLLHMKKYHYTKNGER